MFTSGNHCSLAFPWQSSSLDSSIRSMTSDCHAKTVAKNGLPKGPKARQQSKQKADRRIPSKVRRKSSSAWGYHLPIDLRWPRERWVVEMLVDFHVKPLQKRETRHDRRPGTFRRGQSIWPLGSFKWTCITSHRKQKFPKDPGFAERPPGGTWTLSQHPTSCSILVEAAGSGCSGSVSC